MSYFVIAFLVKVNGGGNNLRLVKSMLNKFRFY